MFAYASILIVGLAYQVRKNPSLEHDAEFLGQAIRKHWSIENQAHWTLDCTFGEDACRIRSGHSPRNIALIRRIALNAEGSRTNLST
jgi:predicted transposase YbfD/YdcC